MTNTTWTAADRELSCVFLLHKWIIKLPVNRKKIILSYEWWQTPPK